MTRTPELASIDCTACGAGLDILGGGRVTTHICPYCGTELDALDGYKALRKFGNTERVATPFPIGSKGALFGVDWTVIGILGLRERHGSKTWEWRDHQLYSPTHGYAWLTLESDHLTFSRRVRGVPASLWIGERWVETAENPPSVRYWGTTYKYLQTSTSSVYFAEGEFTWAPSTGDTTVTVSAMSSDEMLDFSQTGTEREIYRSTWLEPAETLAAFGLPPDLLRPSGVHAIQPFREWAHARFLSGAALACAGAALVLGLVLSFLPGRSVLDPVTINFSQLPRVVTFEIDEPSPRLAGLYFSSNVSNSWAYVEIELTDPEDEVLFEAGRTMEYYYGRDSDGAWSEGSGSASLHFLPPLPGTYTLSVDAVEQGTWGFDSRDATSVTVSAKQGMSSGFYLFLLTGVFVLLAALFSVRRFIHNRRRWAHSDWSDD